MSRAGGMAAGFVGRLPSLARLTGALDRAFAGRSQLVLVSGEAGIGKTALAQRLAEEASGRGATVVWGTCWNAEQAPGFWPWAQALRSLLHELPPGWETALGANERSELARLVPGVGDQPAASTMTPDTPEQGRFPLFAAVGSFLEAAGRQRPLVIFLDDLQWADASSLDLLAFLARAPRAAPLLIGGAYRHDELDGADRLAALATRSESVRLTGLDRAEVTDLVRATAGAAAADDHGEEVYRRSGGHPFLARELAHLLATHPSPDEWRAVPDAVREFIEHRLPRLPEPCQRLLEAAAVAGSQLRPDVLGDVCGAEPGDVVEIVAEAIDDGILRPGDLFDEPARFAHDLFRETLIARVPARRRLSLHQQVGAALERRCERGGLVFAAELARHFSAAIVLDGPDRAVRWARQAAAFDRDRLAFGEAATHLARVRQAALDHGVDLPAGAVVDLLVDEADALARSGEAGAARGLLDQALSLARALPDPAALAAVALGVAHLGARAGMPRDLASLLEEAGAAVAGSGSPTEARLTAELARALSFSVPDRRRAGSLSERALEIARAHDDPATLATCLLARHDAVWAPGSESERLGLATEIAMLSERHGDQERHAEAVLLRATALLELGSPAFRPELAAYLRLTRGLGQPRHEYLALSRQAALAILDGRLTDGRALADEAAALGARIAEPDTANVRLCQAVAMAWASREPGELAGVADEAVGLWVALPAYAHTVAAGLRAAGDDATGAAAALAVVTGLGGWRGDRSILLSSSLGLLTLAAVQLGNDGLCAELYEELAPLAGVSGVIGAMVCFMGSYAHWAGVAAAALGRVDEARAHLRAAVLVHERLGARVWAAASRAELAKLAGADEGAEPAQAERHERARVEPAAPAPGPVPATLRRDGELWEIAWKGLRAHLRDAKGFADLAVLLARPGVDVHVLDLASPDARVTRAEPAGGPVLDSRAAADYRRRLAELDDERAEAADHHDEGRLASLDSEREALLDELRTAAGIGGRARPLGGDATQRARKAVFARLRDAVRRVEAVIPELGAHLDRSLITGVSCRYQPVEPVTWSIEPD